MSDQIFTAYPYRFSCIMANLSVFIFIGLNLILTGSAQQCDIQGECFNATLIGISITDNAKHCLEACKEAVDVSGCNWYSYNPQTQICEFLENCNDIQGIDCPQCVSGEVTCPIYQCDVHGLCMGNIIDSSIENSKHECLKSCKINDDCHWYSYGKKLKTCLLFSTCPALNENEVDYVSGQAECQDLGGPLTKVLIVTGSTGGSDNLKTSEVIDLQNPGNQCDDLGNHTKEVFAASGGMLNGTYPLVCGGVYGFKECSILGYDLDPVYLKEDRSFASSVMVRFDNGYEIQDVLWITGGENPQPTGTSEFVFMFNGTLNTIEGPRLPVNVLGHCMIALNENTFMLIGGGNAYEYDTNTTFIIRPKDVKNNTTLNEDWIEGPKLEIPRRVHACGIVNVPGTKYAVVSGGASTLSRQSVEFLDINDMQRGWFPGPYLPKPLLAHSMVSTENSLVVIGGVDNFDEDSVSKDLFELSCLESGCQWREMEPKMKVGRSHMVAMMVPDDLTNCEA